MKQPYPKFSALSLILFLFFACSSNLSRSIPVPEVLAVEGAKSTLALQAHQSELQISEVLDERSSAVIATLDNKSSEFSGDVPKAVGEAIEASFRRKNFVFIEGAPLLLSVKLKKWDASVTSGMPKSIDALARVTVEVKDPAYRKVYVGQYEGTALLEKTSIGDSDLSKSLNAAMSEAIKQMILDEKLMRVLSSF